MNETNVTVKRMEIYMANLPFVGGSVQQGQRPVLIVQNDIGNLNSSTVIVVPLTSKLKKPQVTHVKIPISMGVPMKSVALCEQIMTLSKDRLIYKLGEITESEIVDNLEFALQAALYLERGKILYGVL